MRAVESDVNDASANAALGWVALYRRHHQRSLAAYEYAIELNPSDADILAEYADALSHTGSNGEAIPLFQRAMRLNPQMSDLYGKDLASAYFNERLYEEAINTIDRMRRPQIADLILTASLALAGHNERAREAAGAVRRARPGFSPDAWITMIPDLHDDDTARFLEGLKRAGL
jgi:tetratricopeptide (TPR) repeat protein